MYKMDHSFLTAITVNIVSFSIGTTMSWSSPVIVNLREIGTKSPFDSAISLEEESWISSLLNLGAAIGPFIFGNLSDKMGRKYTILGTGIPLLLGYLSMSYGKSVIFFYAGRFLCGLSVGGVLSVVPLYICEIADVHNRGQLSSVLNMNIIIGSLFSFCLGPYVSVQRFNLILVVFPCIFLVLFSIVGTESPYYYMIKGKYESAKESLQKIRGSSTKVEEELNIIQKNISQADKGTFLSIFRSKATKKAFFLILGLMIYQQLSGIVAIVFYAELIFIQSRVPLDPAVCSILIGVTQTITSFIIPLLIERIGRKKLLLLSSIGMVLSEGPLGIYFYFKDYNYDVSSVSFIPLICVLMFIVAYNLGCGPLPWIVMGEILPANVKSSASLFATFFCFTMGFFIARFFQTIATMMGTGLVFIFFTISCGISILFIKFLLFETKGRTLEDIQKYLVG